MDLDIVGADEGDISSIDDEGNISLIDGTSVAG
jgi:hypothetical protein